MSTAGTITREELATALKRRGLSSLADYLFDDIVREREPEYERGHFYEDALGRVFFRLLGDGDGWSSAPEGTPYPGDYPRRPLRKLVPEPGPTARVSRSQVIDTLGTLGMHEPARVSGIADYIMALLRGEGS